MSIEIYEYVILISSILGSVIYFNKYFSGKNKHKKTRIQTISKQTENTTLGNIGESKVAKILSNYHHINDVYISLDGHTSQIDHLLLLNDGSIILLETKHWGGTILDSPYLNQIKIRDGQNKISVRYSPKAQTMRHKDYLSIVLNYKKLKSFVVFTANTKFDNDKLKYDWKIWAYNLTELEDFVKHNGKLISEPPNNSYWRKLIRLKKDSNYQNSVGENHLSKIIEKNKKNEEHQKNYYKPYLKKAFFCSLISVISIVVMSFQYIITEFSKHIH